MSIRASTARGRTREVERLVTGTMTVDGAGVRLLRIITPDLHLRLDPFLMLDEFGSDQPEDYVAGFPDHPHRGFETVTYMLAGRMRHRDNAGHESVLGKGGVQWMTAGRGIIHSEIPEQDEGWVYGFQLWINLPAKEKMTAPAHREIPAEAIPAFTAPDGARVKVIAGCTHGIAGAVQKPATEPLFLDLAIPARSRYQAELPADHTAFLYVYGGEVSVGERRQMVKAHTLAILGNRPEWEQVYISAVTPARLLLIAGRPLREPIAQWGPFVMNTRREAERAMRDYREGRL